MIETILLDSVDFGIPESERLHPAQGSLARSSEHPQCCYGTKPHLVEDDPGVHHWRDWGDWTAVTFEVPEGFSELDLLFSITLRAYKVGEPPSQVLPLKYRVQCDEKKLTEGAFEPTVGSEWTVFETDLFRLADPSGVSVSLALDNLENLHGETGHYGISIASARLLAVLTRG
jgi:hypothetical protein